MRERQGKEIQAKWEGKLGTERGIVENIGPCAGGIVVCEEGEEEQSGGP